jgi:adenylate kinase family enzyme
MKMPPSPAAVVGAGRIAIIGSPGSGKTRLGRRLSKLTGAPHHSLDDLYWRAGWKRAPEDVWEQCIRDLLGTERWIIDGNYLGSIRPRLQAAQAVIWLDLPTSVCLLGLLQRWLVQLVRPRSALPRRIAEQGSFADRLYLDPKLVLMVWRFRNSTRPQVLTEIVRLDATARTLTLRTRAEVNAFVARCASVDAAIDAQEVEN